MSNFAATRGRCVKLWPPAGPRAQSQISAAGPGALLSRSSRPCACTTPLLSPRHHLYYTTVADLATYYPHASIHTSSHLCTLFTSQLGRQPPIRNSHQDSHHSSRKRALVTANSPLRRRGRRSLRCARALLFVLGKVAIAAQGAQILYSVRLAVVDGVCGDERRPGQVGVGGEEVEASRRERWDAAGARRHSKTSSRHSGSVSNAAT